MQHPCTLSTAMTANRKSATLKDPMSDARTMLHRAARLPFAANRPLAWRSKFAQLVGDARACVRQHAARAARPDSPIAQIERDEPRLHGAVERQRQEHADLARQMEALYAEARVVGGVDIWRMIDLGERAILLEMALTRHHNRLLRLVHETTNRELGGESG